ncbi:MAG: hybrid sensor histidine kinase/response regulator, partial [Planctomycetota bacterium]
LARLLVMQSVIGQLPDRQQVLDFLDRGLREVPGVAEARLSQLENPGPDEIALPVRVPEQHVGWLILRLSDRETFAPYRSLIANLCFMVAVILDSQRLKRLEARYTHELERQVSERTAELEREIQERTAAEAAARADKEALANERHRLVVTLRSIGDGVLCLDPAGRITICNAAAAALLDRSESDLLHCDIRDCLPLSGADTPSFLQVLETDAMQERQLQIGDRSIEIHTAPIRDGSDSPLGAILVLRDISERLHMQDLMQRTDRIDSLGLVAGGIAHDFNNMLGGAFGFVELALEQLDDSERIRDYLSNSLVAFDRARNLTRQLLTFAKGGEPIREVIELEKILRETCTFALSGSKVSCRFDIVDDLGHCHADPHQLAQVFENLVINAKQAMPDGGTIRVHGERVVLPEQAPLLHASVYCRLRFEDDGPGIPDILLPRIFDPFFTTKQTGNGLGLATCHSIINKHDGVIEAGRASSGGASFTILLPAFTEQHGHQGQKHAEQRHGSGRILVMDDEPAVTEVLAAMLDMLGYESICCRRGEEALTIASGETDLQGALLDLTIVGGMDGQTTATRLRELRPELPLIATSGYSADPIMADPTAFDFDGAIAKPYRLSELSLVLNAYVGKAH